jgi:hypothetical protein
VAGKINKQGQRLKEKEEWHNVYPPLKKGDIGGFSEDDFHPLPTGQALR